MGLAEYIKAGVTLRRDAIGVQTDAVRSGSVNLGSSYILLSITTTVPCRLRLYDNQTSRDVLGEKNRVFGNTNVSASTALIGDFSMSAAGTYTIDPVVYGIINDPTSKLTYYLVDNVSSAPYPSITFNRYLLEDSSISIQNRKTLQITSHTLSPGNYGVGAMQSSDIPRTYLLVSGSVSGSTSIARVRLYSTSESLANSTEISRSFATESAESSKLIFDAIISGSEVTHFVPKITGANLKTMGTDLNLIKSSTEKIMGVNEMYYVIQNAATSGPATPINVSLHVFSLED